MAIELKPQSFAAQLDGQRFVANRERRLAQMKQVPTLVCVDVEPDTRRPQLDHGADWKGFEKALRLFEDLRSRFQVGVFFCWFVRMDPQIELLHGSAFWAVERYHTQIESLRRAGDEVGLHTHAWRRVDGEWISDYTDQGWINECVRVSFGAYKSAFGGACRSFRFGDHWMNDETFNLAESLGARYNLTVEPGLRSIVVALPGETSTGRFPDYARAPREPYRPARDNFRRSGEARGEKDSWVIPVSTVLLPRWPDAPFYRRVVWRARYGRRSYHPLSLALEPNHFRQSISDVVEGESERHLCVVVRTDAVLDQLLSGHVRSNLEFLLSKASDGHLQLTTPAHLVAGQTPNQQRRELSPT